MNICIDVAETYGPMSEWKNESLLIKTQQRWTLGFLTSEQFHRPKPLSPLKPPLLLMNRMADAMPCCKTQSLCFALFFPFFFLFDSFL